MKWLLFGASYAETVLYAAHPIIKRLLAKWSIVVAMLGYSFYILASMLPLSYSEAMAFIMLGGAGVLMAVASRFYLTQV